MCCITAISAASDDTLNITGIDSGVDSISLGDDEQEIGVDSYNSASISQENEVSESSNGGEILSMDENQDKLSEDGDGLDLSNAIANTYGLLELKKNYTFTSQTSGITINKDLVIDGKGHYIDANGYGRIFTIELGKTVTLKNITFKWELW